LFIDTHNPGFLPKLSSATAPTRPNAKLDIIDRQRGRWDDAEHANECLHAIDFAADVLAKNGALQIWKNNVRFHR